MGKTAEKAAEKAELRAERSKESLGPTKVHFFVYVMDIDNIDGATRGILEQKTFPETVYIECDSTIIYHQRYTGLISQPLNLSDFPFDQSNFSIQVITTGNSLNEIEFVPNSSMAESPPGGANVSFENTNIYIIETADA